MKRLALALALALGACDEAPGPDAGATDAGADAGPLDDGGDDAGPRDDAGADAALEDAGPPACSPACEPCEECVAGACVSVGAPRAIARMRSGWYHLLAIDADAALYVWGENDNGQLGLGDHDDRLVATRVPGRWIAADGGSRHSCAVHEDGTLRCMGANVHGQLGTGDLDDRDAPTEVAPDAERDRDNPWVDVACGGLHTCGLKRDGTVWCFGSSVAGQLGLGPPTADVLVPTRVGGGAPPIWRAVSAQTRHTCAILAADESLHCWGDNSNGQIGQGDADRADRHTPHPVLDTAGRRFAAVRNGALHTCAIDEDGALDCFGQGSYGQLGVAGVSDHGHPARVGVDFAAVAAGFEHSCAVSVVGHLFCWGTAVYRQLGLDDGDTHLTPVRVGAGDDWTTVVAGYYHSCGQRTDGTVHCWGDHGRGQQGGGRDLGPVRPTPGPVCFPVR